MQSSTETAKQTIISSLKLFSGETQATSSFPWTFSGYNGIPVEEINYDELRAHLRVAKSVEDLLRQMLASASSAVTDLSCKFDEMAIQRSFQALPDEILAIVFEMLYKSHSENDKLRSVNHLSLVSHRFRRIVIGLPVLWSNICSRSLHINKAKLVSSRATTPTISLSILGAVTWNPKESEDVRVLNYYKLAVSISSRIRILNIYISSSDLSQLQKIREICSSISLPSVIELILGCDTDVSRVFQDICRDWNMPALKKLDLDEILPQLPPDVMSKIHSCSIEINYTKDVWRTDEILGFLLSLKTVKVLRVLVRLFGTYGRSSKDSKMDSVQNLTLELQNTRVAMDRNILHFIKFPSITSFKLDLGIKDVNDLDNALENVTFLTPPTSVNNVTLAVGMEFEKYESRKPTSMVGEWCNVFEGLECLTLESDKKKTHGLLSFAASVDAIRITDFKGGIDGDYLHYLPYNSWDSQLQYRTAVIAAKHVGNSGKGKIRFIETRRRDDDEWDSY
ncbi:hypothetical protein SCHPADRAFT_1002468 [Schizopora paradoxa]|uniref:Uncharacterized protein n=1 Tax=Schizopora paradoxa TaxID=27342 RepID=A0A0H2R353_9AGAM|nr:hypothetical protein SCHPADRAFT_1002468 [Schizopora paradoxa]